MEQFALGKIKDSCRFLDPIPQSDRMNPLADRINANNGIQILRLPLCSQDSYP